MFGGLIPSVPADDPLDAHDLPVLLKLSNRRFKEIVAPPSLEHGSSAVASFDL